MRLIRHAIILWQWLTEIGIKGQLFHNANYYLDNIGSLIESEKTSSADEDHHTVSPDGHHDDHEFTDSELIDALIENYNEACNGDIMCKAFNAQFEAKARREGLPLKMKLVAVEIKKFHDELHAGEGHDGETDPGINRNSVNCESPDCKVPQPLWGIWDYGCWCNFGQNLMTGSGVPVNEFDEACKKLQLCERCVVHDLNCDPRTQVYNATLGWINSEEALLADCKSLNPGNDCAVASCCCELQLIADILNLMWSAVVYNPTYKHSSGWDRNEHCVKRNNDESSEDPNNRGPNGNRPRNDPTRACCGGYPSRYMYNVYAQSCCQDRTIYSPMLQDCCEDGTSAGIGLCPDFRRRKRRFANNNTKRKKIRRRRANKRKSRRRMRKK